MSDGIFATVISKTRDANALNNAIYVQLSDGTNAINVTSGSLDVNITNTSIIVTATNLDIRDLVHTQDSIKIGDGTDFISINADGSLNITDNGGSITVDGSLTVSATDLDIRDLDHTQDDILVYGNDGTTDQKVKTNTSGKLQVEISKDNNANSETNPIYVHNVDTVVSGEEIHDYNTDTVIADGTSNHDYTVTGTTFLLKSIIISGSGNIKFEIQTGPLASLVTKTVGFLTGRAGDTKQVFFDPALEIPSTSTGTIRVIRTNRENQSTDVYSTIIGNDV